MIKEKILSGETFLGIELGSTRIKGCLITEDGNPVATGGYEWENKYENGYWTYSLDDIHKGLKGCFADLSKNIFEKYGVVLTDLEAMGISGMMHGYLAFDKDGNLLTPFRTWRNTTTEKASEQLSDLFNCNIPQRWSVAHLYQAILNNESHISKIAHITTLSGYIHYLLTGRYELGIGDASGMFPVTDGEYDREMIEKFRSLVAGRNLPWDIKEILPVIKKAGEKGAFLSAEGASFLDEKGNLKEGVPVCPPEGDAGTGMVATNSVLPKTGNVSAGTSVFSMLVLERPLKNAYSEVDIATTPDGTPVAMIHCNNCCGELDSWVKVFSEFAEGTGINIDKSSLYEFLYKKALCGEEDCGGITAYNYLSGEHITGVKSGNPMYFRGPNSRMTLANFMRAELYSAMATLKIGMDILFDKEKVHAAILQAHGGLFKVQGVAQQLLADALDTRVSVMETSGEGGAWGIAILALYMAKAGEEVLGEWLEQTIFSNMKVSTLSPSADGNKGFLEYMERYKKGLPAEKELEKI